MRFGRRVAPGQMPSEGNGEGREKWHRQRADCKCSCSRRALSRLLLIREDLEAEVLMQPPSHLGQKVIKCWERTRHGWQGSQMAAASCKFWPLQGKALTGCFSSAVVQSLSHVPTFCDSMSCNTPGFPVLH